MNFCYATEYVIDEKHHKQRWLVFHSQIFYFSKSWKTKKAKCTLLTVELLNSPSFELSSSFSAWSESLFCYACKSPISWCIKLWISSSNMNLDLTLFQVLFENKFLLNHRFCREIISCHQISSRKWPLINCWLVYSIPWLANLIFFLRKIRSELWRKNHNNSWCNTKCILHLYGFFSVKKRLHCTTMTKQILLCNSTLDAPLWKAYFIIVWIDRL